MRLRRQLILLLMLSTLLMAGTHYHRLQLSLGDDALDSLRVWQYANGTITDSFKFTSFPVVDSILIGDTLETKLTYWFYFTGDAGTYRSSWETVEGNPTGGYIDSNLQGISNPNRIFTVVVIDSSGTDELIPGASTDLKNAALTTLQQKNGSPVVFSVNDATFTLVSVAGGFTCDTSVIVVTGNQEDTVYCYNTPDPGAAAGVDFVRAYIDIGEVHIDTLTGAPIPYKNVELFLDLIGNPIAISGDWFLPPLTYKGKTNAAGRVSFDVPANTKMSPNGTYYSLRYEARGRRGRLRGHIGNFVIDTLPDPLQIINAMSVWNANE